MDWFSSIVVESSPTQLYPRFTVAALTGSGRPSCTTARDAICPDRFTAAFEKIERRRRRSATGRELPLPAVDPKKAISCDGTGRCNHSGDPDPTDDRDLGAGQWKRALVEPAPDCHPRSRDAGMKRSTLLLPPSRWLRPSRRYERRQQEGRNRAAAKASPSGRDDQGRGVEGNAVARSGQRPFDDRPRQEQGWLRSRLATRRVGRVRRARRHRSRAGWVPRGGIFGDRYPRIWPSDFAPFALGSLTPANWAGRFGWSPTEAPNRIRRRPCRIALVMQRNAASESESHLCRVQIGLTRRALYEFHLNAGKPE